MPADAVAGDSEIPSERSGEIELKLEIRPADLPRLRAHPLLAGLGAPRRLTSVYFDTPDLRLHQAELSLRVRTDGGRHVQTVKTAGDGAGLFSRGEWETAVADGAPDLDAAAATPLGDLLSKDAVRKALAPRFALEVDRATAVVEESGAEVELALDAGRVAAGERQALLVELELELKSGRTRRLFEVAEGLFEAAPLRLSARSKAEVGYDLLGEAADHVKSAPVPLDRAMTVAEAFQTIGRACLSHFLKNERLVRERRSVEAVHQARVAVRRLRAAMSLFGDLLDDPQSTQLKVDLRQVASALGAARDLDVLGPRLRETATPAADPADRERLLAALETRRLVAYDEAVAMLESPALGRLTFDVAAWLEAGAWLTAADVPHAILRDEPIVRFARDELGRRTRKLRKSARHLDDLDPPARHRVRIRAKKVRYGAEFFSALADGKKARKEAEGFIEALKPMQDALGDLNDVATAGRWLHALSADSLGPVGFAAGAAAEEIARAEKALLKDAAKAAAKFEKREQFL